MFDCVIKENNILVLGDDVPRATGIRTGVIFDVEATGILLCLRHQKSLETSSLPKQVNSTY